MRELAVNMISKIKSTPVTELPDQDLHEKMFYLEHDVEDYLSEDMINEKIEAFKQKMKDEQGIIVTTTHRNSLIQAEIETKEEYLRLNQGSGESVLDRTSSGTSGLIVNDDPEVTKIKNSSQKSKENETEDSKNLKMKSKFEGMKGFKAPKPTKERTPDEKSNLEDVKNSISVEWMKGALEESETEEEDAVEDEDFDGEEGRVRRQEVNEKGKKGGKGKVEEEEVEDEEAAEARRKEQVERLERINAMKGKEYLIGWG
jgi:hypothetical protein